MSALSMTLLIVLVSDQAIKLLLRRLLRAGVISLGPFGSVRMVTGRLWLRRLSGQCSGVTIWCLWVAAAVFLVIVSPLVPSSALFAGLLLGGSLSHAIESSLRGSIIDYISLRFWPAFNLADLALVVGAIGMIGELLIRVRTMVF
jgi:lipoprotein signal peptidase